MDSIDSEIIGKKFGRLTVVSRSDRVCKDYRRYYNCECDCGKGVIVSKGNLGKSSNSCGCLRIENTKTKLTKHGDSSSLLYDVYFAMNKRCKSSNSESYKHYGERGITVCKEWEEDIRAFLKWAKDNGYKEGLEIDRINVDGNYEPDNCRWVNPSCNAMNKRSLGKSKHVGITICEDKRNPYRVRVRFLGKAYFLGCFDSIETAIEIRKLFVDEIIEKFGNLNRDEINLEEVDKIYFKIKNYGVPPP